MIAPRGTGSISGHDGPREAWARGELAVRGLDTVRLWSYMGLVNLVPKPTLPPEMHGRFPQGTQDSQEPPSGQEKRLLSCVCPASFSVCFACGAHVDVVQVVSSPLFLECHLKLAGGSGQRARNSPRGESWEMRRDHDRVCGRAQVSSTTAGWLAKEGVIEATGDDKDVAIINTPLCCHWQLASRAAIQDYRPGGPSRLAGVSLPGDELRLTRFCR